MKIIPYSTTAGSKDKITDSGILLYAAAFGRDALIAEAVFKVSLSGGFRTQDELELTAARECEDFILRAADHIQRLRASDADRYKTAQR